MSNKPDERLDRRDFMIASVATIGASAGLVANAASASAEASTQNAADPASATVYTGDVIQGRKVVSALDVQDLEPGKKHHLYFQGVEMPTGQHWYVSVTVAKGARPGKRVVLVSGVHGDEMSSVHTVQTLMNSLDPAQMSGAVMAVTDVSRPAMEGMQRRWPNAGRGADLIDMNREWPGNENGLTAPSRHAGLLFNRLLRPNADAAIDFHTGTTGFEVTAFNIGGMDVPEVKAMVELYPVGQVFDNHVYPGVLHNAFMDVGIPAFTPEIGAARVLDRGMIALFVEGTMNVLKHHGIVAGPMGRTGKDVSVFIGNSAFPIVATEGGLVEHLVRLNDKVEPGQKVAIQRNSFGEVVAEYISGVAGEVTGQRSDAMAEPGNPLVFILFHKDDGPDRAETYPE
ncbi:M14 family metallopeptidase [Ancylobacter polymorphus]|uniref:Deacylase n=1 Tax=Ancylobacter polymorphus TaxID=223390 RepID=A0ABU0B764_9HYPH|nr:succinylglutamate desuccinylase/aspartoacylase family protein [Ancylobacter polymorphus]MDQ0301666.1 putative deacylase [Ancylobacter polymorphus]RTL91732.1 succinylglutamate desuccinylase/aspartoacylase family protein [Ancylobacter aquaticus]